MPRPPRRGCGPWRGDSRRVGVEGEYGGHGWIISLWPVNESGAMLQPCYENMRCCAILFTQRAAAGCDIEGPSVIRTGSLCESSESGITATLMEAFWRSSEGKRLVGWIKRKLLLRRMDWRSLFGLVLRRLSHSDEQQHCSRRELDIG
jgi:hypothetical protein